MTRSSITWPEAGSFSLLSSKTWVLSGLHLDLQVKLGDLSRRHLKLGVQTGLHLDLHVKLERFNHATLTLRQSPTEGTAPSVGDWGKAQPSALCWRLTLKARSHRQNVAGAFLERWGEGAEFWQRSSPRTKWQTKSKTERWFSDDASVDKAAFCACRRWFGGGLTLVKRNTAFDYGAERIASSDKWLKDTTSVFSIFLL